MSNERNNEDLVIEFFRTDDMLLKKDKKKIEAVFEKQSSENETIKEILSTASKNGKGNIGKPEGIFTFTGHKELVMFWEAKGNPSEHSSSDLVSDPENKAVDGAIHYATKALESGHFAKAVALATSGFTIEELIVSYYVLELNHDKTVSIQELKNPDGVVVEDLVSLHKMLDFLFPKTVEEQAKHDNKVRDDIHGLMRKASLSEENKPLVLAASLLALKDNSFRKIYPNVDHDDLGEYAFNSIDSYIKRNGLLDDTEKRERFIKPFTVIKNHSHLHVVPDGEVSSYYYQILDILSKSGVLDSLNPDVIGDFYTEFLKYSGGDGKGLGIVLTPHHITELFSDLVYVDKNSTIIDTCSGTGSFLNSGLQKMLSDGSNEEEIERIKNSIVSVELDPKMFTLGATNMLLRGANIDNFFEGSAFDRDLTEKIDSLDSLPNAGMLNPPYSLKKNGGKSEIEFIENMLGRMRKGGFVAALVPVSTGTGTNKTDVVVKERILKNHTLWAVMSLPSDLFMGRAGTIVQILVFKAGFPHKEGFKTWFANWKDDGFVLRKHVGRGDFNGKWDSIKAMWLERYESKEETAGFSILKSVSGKDEWATEAYLETDYTLLTFDTFQRKMRDYVLYELANTPDGDE